MKPQEKTLKMKVSAYNDYSPFALKSDYYGALEELKLIGLQMFKRFESRERHTNDRVREAEQRKVKVEKSRELIIESLREDIKELIKDRDLWERDCKKHFKDKKPTVRGAEQKKAKEVINSVIDYGLISFSVLDRQELVKWLKQKHLVSEGK